MRKFFPAAAALLLSLACALPAHAEKWIWFQVKGGAIAFDADSKKADVTTGETSGNTLIFYEQPRPVDMETYHFVAERLAFECRGERQKWSQSAVLDLDGKVVRARPDGDWTAIGAEMGSAGIFKRLLCLGETPPNTKEAATFEAAMNDIRASAAGSSNLAALAYATPTAPGVTPPAAPPAPKAPEPAAAAPIATAPIATAPRPSAPPPAPAPEPAQIASVPPVKTLDDIIQAPPPRPVQTGLTPAGTTPYPAADRCVNLKQQDSNRYVAFNDCPYQVNFAWCVTGGVDQGFECGGPFVVRVSSSVAARSNARSPYLGGAGRLRVFACRAPGVPKVTSEGGRFDYACLGPDTSSAASRPPLVPTGPAAKAPVQPLPKLRPLTP